MKKSVLTRYRVMAYVTGVLLIRCACMIAKYGSTRRRRRPTRSRIAHGWLYVVYLVFAFDLGSKAKWPVGKQLWVLIAGTIPTAAFFVERRISRELERRGRRRRARRRQGLRPRPAHRRRYPYGGFPSTFTWTS